jgi:hypothetical protein
MRSFFNIAFTITAVVIPLALSAPHTIHGEPTILEYGMST